MVYGCSTTLFSGCSSHPLHHPGCSQVLTFPAALFLDGDSAWKNNSVCGAGVEPMGLVGLQPSIPGSVTSAKPENEMFALMDAGLIHAVKCSQAKVQPTGLAVHGANKLHQH